MQPKDFYNETADVYDIRHNTPSTQIVRKTEREISKKFAKGLVLDFGCGTGHHLKFLDSAIGLDISRKMLKRALDKKKPLILCDENVCFRNGIFDAVTCFLTVLNMCDYEKTIKEFNRVLKPKGLVIVSVASIKDQDKNTQQKTVRVCGKRMKLHLFSKEEIIDVFRKNGFSLEYFYSVFILQKPKWGNFENFSFSGKIKLFLERFLPKDGCMYFAVFKKSN